MQKSISGYRVLLEDAPVMFKSSTQKSVALSVCEAEQTAGVLCAQDMLYVQHILESMGLKVKLPMILEMDNRGAVDLANNWVLVVLPDMSMYDSVSCGSLRSPRYWTSVGSRVRRMMQMRSQRT